jgi:hypothetical protein
MTIIDIRLLNAATNLHEIARVVEQDLGIGDVSISIRAAADQLFQVIKGEQNGTD